jgi:hypothetical protein
MRTAVHFVGFRDESYHAAVRVWGKPDFFHRYWDHRATGDVAPGDTVVFARQKDWDRFISGKPVEFAFNDSEVF